MDKQFWITAWEEGRTAFHRSHYHEKLVQYFPTFDLEAPLRILVPLCGKTKDMIWLAQQGHTVHGVELYEPPVQSFFEENKLSEPRITESPDFKTFTEGEISISVGDFFKLDRASRYDFIYDRAALVALPREMRVDYSEVLIEVLKPGGHMLLMSYEYDEATMQGPPFNVTEDEILGLYGRHFSILKLESDQEGPRRQKVFHLVKNALPIPMEE